MLYALLATPFLLRGCVDVWQEMVPPIQATLVVASDVSISALSIRLDGREYETWPPYALGDRRTAMVSGLRPRRRDSMIEVSWRTAQGERSLLVEFDMNDSAPPICLLVLRLDVEGAPIQAYSHLDPPEGVVLRSCGH